MARFANMSMCASWDSAGIWANVKTWKKNPLNKGLYTFQYIAQVVCIELSYVVKPT